MNIILAKHCGFCYGVKRAVNMVLECAAEKIPASTLGPIIHNPQMVEKLASMGVGQVNKLDEISQGRVIIRSHGVGPNIYDEAKQRGLEMIDATCPHVKKAQLSARELRDEEYTVVVIGEHHHPEVQSIVAWAGEGAIVLETMAEAEELSFIPRMGIVAQTTFSGELFANIVEVLKRKSSDMKVHRTICTATDQRQEAALAVAKQVQAMLVVGGKNSANTSHLADLCRTACERVYHIETAQELQEKWFANVGTVGITAGASTPDWLIEEVIQKMQEQETVQSQEHEFTKVETGSIVKGKIVGVRKDEVFVDVGYKAEGVIPLSELAYPIPENASEVVSEGQEIDVYVIDADGGENGIQLSKVKADATLAWEKLQQAYENKQAVDVHITETVKGGLSVAVYGIRGFVPASQIDNKYVEDLTVFVGQDYPMIPIEVDPDRKKCVLSRRMLLEEERRLQEEQTYASLAVGQVLKGVVRRLVPFGAFVDIGGVDGLLHVSDMSWQRIASPDEVVKEGDILEVMVQKVDTANKRISLSLKQMQQDPWFAQAAALTEGQVLKGAITKTSKFGAFVKLAAGIEGLVHISEMAERRVTSADEIVKPGQEVSVKILNIDCKAKRIALSMVQAQQDADRNEYKQYLENAQTTSGITIGDKLGYLFKREE
ncbi:MAG: 4-hydroxy-3-methylbut-2-enyl diphosphate reductase [Firmicutes bacterium]|nr:4-hydroxy-3-methylbut-2-enyl diphosphate reductase [Bacillota bacterium]